METQYIAIAVIGVLFLSTGLAETTNTSDVTPIPPTAPVTDDPVIGGDDGDGIDFEPNVTEITNGELEIIGNEDLNVSEDFSVSTEQHVTPVNTTVEVTNLERNKGYTVIKYKSDGEPVKVTEFNSGDAGIQQFETKADRTDYLAEEGYLHQIYKGNNQTANFYVVPRMTLFSVDSFTNGETDDWYSSNAQRFRDTSEKLYTKINTKYDEPKSGHVYKNESIDSDKEAVTLRLSTGTSGYSNTPDYKFAFSSVEGDAEYGKVKLDGDQSHTNYTIFYNENTGDIQVNREDGEIVGSVSVPTTVEDEEFYWRAEARVNDDQSGSRINIHEYGVVPKFSKENWQGLLYKADEEIEATNYDITSGTSAEMRFSTDKEFYTSFPDQLPQNKTQVHFRWTGDPADFEIMTMDSEEESSGFSLFGMSLFR